MFNSKKIAKLESEIEDLKLNKAGRQFAHYIATVLGLDVFQDSEGVFKYKESKNGRNALLEITAIQSECQKKINDQNKLIGTIVNKLGTLSLLEKKVALLEDLLGVQWATQEAQPAKSGYIKVATPKIPKVKKTKK